MSWTKQTDHWSRPLDCHDRLFQFIGESGKPLGREHWLTIGAVQLDFPNSSPEITIPRLRNAWKSLRMRYPDIAGELHDHEKRYYPITSASTLESWCNNTFKIEDSAQSADDLFTHHLRIADPHATAHWIPSSQEFCIVSAHWRWDGTGLAMVLDQFLSELQNPITTTTASFDGSEATRLIPSLDTVIGMPASPETRNPEWSRRADELLATFLEGQPSIGLPVLNPTALPAKSLRTEHVIPAEQATALRRACRARNITLTTAMHASAIIETARAANSTNPSSRYISWQAFDLRKYLPPPYDGPIHGPSLRMVGLPLNVEATPTTSWSDLVDTIQPLYRQSWNLADSDMMFVRVPFVEKATAMFQAAAAAGAAQPTEPNINSLGPVDRLIRESYGEVKVKGLVLMVQMLAQQLYVHCWSWRDELHLSASYNEAYYEPVFVEAWLGAMKENMVRNLLEDTTDTNKGALL
ncbi:hypothetical protein AAWM_10642 [Aspergillus awamori]|uniref:Uncharacterized protein n=1 Tax=Aspergillus awamori TaxID=105351 RepID=A0A401L8A5_ASPAW|nr:hypothetical protein AAWM_10642 [Aspergillus awamori]GKZ62291.1 hypothetical protein AnigIFM49718_009375 [Aspergillus niger]